MLAFVRLKTLHPRGLALILIQNVESLPPRHGVDSTAALCLYDRSIALVDIEGFEPTTSCLQSRHSPTELYAHVKLYQCAKILVPIPATKPMTNHVFLLLFALVFTDAT